MLFYRIFSFVIPIVNGILISLLFWRVNLIYPVLIVLGLVSFFGPWCLINKKVLIKKELFFYAFFGLLQVLSGLFFFLFLENFFIKIVLALIIVILNFIYLNELFIQFYKKTTVQPEKLWAIFYSIQISSIFFIASNFFGLRDFLSIPFIYLLLIFFILVIILSRYNNFQDYSLKINPKWFRVIIAFIISQIFWAISLLPQVYYLKGILVALFYSIIINLIIWQLGQKVQTKLIRSYLIISIIVILLILFTSQWF